MKVHVFNFWQNTQGVAIEAGIYDMNDPKLRGKGAYIVGCGQGAYVEIPDDADIVPFADESAIEPAINIEYTKSAQELIAESGVDQSAFDMHFKDLEQFEGVKVGVAEIRSYLAQIDHDVL